MVFPDSALNSAGASAYLAYGSYTTPEILYLTGFRSSDPVIYLKRNGEPGFIIVSLMEYERAKREASCGVITRNEAGLTKIIEDERDTWKSLASMIHGLTQGPVMVHESFPYAFGKVIAEKMPVFIDRTVVPGLRAVKSEKEAGFIERSQRAAEEAIDTAVTLIRNSKEKKGELFHNGVPLTSGLVKSAMHKVLLDRGCHARDTIVTSGKDTSIPHMTDSGPLLTDSPIIIDIFPQDDATGYYADMTRTVVHGEPADEIKDMWAAVKDASGKAMKLAKPGITGAEIHAMVVDSFREAGYPSGKEGFTHNTGHGIGLEVHEPPVIGANGAPLLKGNVITIEPGLYFHSIGGVRLENLGILKADGFQCFTKYPEDLIL